MIDPIHIAAPDAITRGPAALPLVARDRDPHSGDGVLRVTPERWRLAQAYEKTTWTETYRFATDDRAADHVARFDGYAAIAGWKFRRAIEVGCGPFTQIKHIPITADRTVLADPLIWDYKNNVPNCSYPQLNTILTHSTLENLKRYTPKFNLVVSINVLQHCSDYATAMAALTDLLAPGGILVFSEPAVRRSDLNEVLASVWDVGHPLYIADDRLVADVKSIGRVIYSNIVENVVQGQPWRLDHYCIVEAPSANHSSVPRGPAIARMGYWGLRGPSMPDARP